MKTQTLISELVAAAGFSTHAVLGLRVDQGPGRWFGLIFYAINFLLFLGIVSKYGWPSIIQFFRNRSVTIRDIRSRAEKAFQEAQELADRAAQQLGQLETDKRKMAAALD